MGHSGGTAVRMIATIVILAVSVALFVYWFRYSCLLVLSTKTTLNYSLDIAEAHGLSFVAAQESVSVAPFETIQGYRRCLEEDYKKVSALVQETEAGADDSYRMECSMLMVNFRCMSLLFDLAGSASERLARAAVREMAQIVEHHANIAGERMAPAAVRH
jgi:hypothetical protein